MEDQITKGREHALHLFKMQAYDLARELLVQGIKTYPLEDSFYGLLGMVESQTNKPEKAIEYFEKAYELNPDAPEHLNNLGLACQALGHFDKAKAYFSQAINADNKFTPAYSNLAMEYRREGSRKKSLETLNKAIEVDEKAAYVHFNKGNIYGEEGLHEEATANYRKAVELEPDNPSYCWNLTCSLLLQGKWTEGWKYFQNRIGVFPQFEKKRNALLTKAPEWNGENLNGKTIYLYCIQGDGDRIQFARYAKKLKNEGAKVIMECPEYLANLMKTVDGVDEVAPAQMNFMVKNDNPQVVVAFKLDETILPQFDYHIAVMDLPRLFNEMPNDVDGKAYMTAPKGPKLETNKYKVGIVWGGNPIHAEDHHRSCPLKHFEILNHPNIQFYALQKDKRDRFWPSVGRVDLMEGASSNFTMSIIDVGQQLDTYNETAAMIEQLDCVVTVDTSVAHLAGALGKKTFLLLANVPDWRWLTEIETTCWYDNMTLARQKISGDWAEVMETVKKQLFFEVEQF